MSVVVDASVIVAVVVADQRQDAARRHLERWLESGDVQEIWSDLAEIGLVLHPFDLALDGPDVAAVTARLRRRHATDSAYVCLASRLGTSLWTLDGALARNAVDVGLPVQLVS